MEKLEAREVFSFGPFGGLDCLPGPWTPAARDTSNLASPANISHPPTQTTTAHSVKTIEGTNLHDRITIKRLGKNAVRVKIQSYKNPAYTSNSLDSTQQYNLTNNQDFYGKLFVNGHNGNDTIDVGSNVNFDTLIKGGRGNDKIYGSSGNNEIHGGHGNDQILGGSGDDVLKGGFGNDQIWGKNGNDVIHGGTGHDRLYGGQHKDTIYGDPDQPYSDAQVQLANKLGKEPADLWPAQFTIYGNDHIEGGSGDDHLYGRADNDTIKGGGDDDKIWGGLGNDHLEGGAGRDEIWGDAGEDVIKGGDNPANLAKERLYGGDDDDTIYGGGGADFIEGGKGNDELRGGQGKDTIYGESGDDKIWGDSGADWISGGDDNDTLNGDSGDDIIEGNGGNDKLNGGSGGDNLWGGPGSDKLWGGRDWRTDKLWGDDSPVNGYGGNDTFYKGWWDKIEDKEKKDTVKKWRWYWGSPF